MRNVVWWIGFLKDENFTSTVYMETKPQSVYVWHLLRSTGPFEALPDAMVVTVVVENGYVRAIEKTIHPC